MAELAPISFAPYVDADAPSEELISRCVHCGLCLPTCPTFAVLGLEADSPRGRIRLMKNVWDGRVDPSAEAFDLHMSRCLDCRACETACPSGVQFGKLVEGARSQLTTLRRAPVGQRVMRRLAFAELLTHPARLTAFAWLGFAARRLGAGWLLRAVGRAVPPAARLGGLLELVPASPPSSAVLAKVFEAQGQRRGRIALFTGCVMRSVYSDTNAATARVLARNGVEVLVPEEQTCCGALHAHAGLRADARELARRNITSLERLEVDAFIVNAAGCGANLKEYGWLLKDDPAWAERAERFAARVKDAAEYLARLGLSAQPGRYRAKVAYDDPCHLLHGQGIKSEPRSLLAAIPELELVELVEADWCCGSAGTYNVTQPELAEKLAHRKAERIRQSGADTVVTANPGCQMQISAGLRAAGMRMPVLHLMDVLDTAYAAAD